MLRPNPAVVSKCQVKSSPGRRYCQGDEGERRTRPSLEPCRGPRPSCSRLSATDDEGGERAEDVAARSAPGGCSSHLAASAAVRAPQAAATAATPPKSRPHRPHPGSVVIAVCAATASATGPRAAPGSPPTESLPTSVFLTRRLSASHRPLIPARYVRVIKLDTRGEPVWSVREVRPAGAELPAGRPARRHARQAAPGMPRAPTRETPVLRRQVRLAAGHAARRVA
jgi:hypothetical protein